MHELVDDGHGIVFLLGQEGQLAFPESVEQDARVGDEQVVAHQQEPPFLRGIFQPPGMQPHQHQIHQRFNIHIHNGAVDRVVLLLRLVQVHQRADDPQKGKGDQEQHRVNARKQQRQGPQRPSKAGKDHTGNQQ